MARTRGPKAWSKSLSDRPVSSFGRILGPLRYLFSFYGRINRTQYWIYWVILIGALAGTQVFLMFSGGLEARFRTLFQHVMISLWVATWFALPVLTTWCCAIIHVKRFHDRNKSGLLFLIALVPVVGTIWVLVQCGFMKGTDGPNRYDENPGGENLVEVFE